MKKALLVLFIASLVVLPLSALAANGDDPNGGTPSLPVGPEDISGLVKVLDTIGDWVFAIFLAMAAIFILIAAFKFLTSGGDPGNVGAARQALLYALIGIAVSVLAKGLVTIVQKVIS